MVTKIYFRLINVLLLTMFVLSTPLQAQFGLTKSDIAGKLGWNYKSGKTTDGNLEYIYYEKEAQNLSGNTYEFVEVYYFNDKGYSIEKKIIEPVEEVNAWVKSFNRQYVSIGNMKWKDYSTGNVYIITTDKGLVTVISFWEGN